MYKRQARLADRGVAKTEGSAQRTVRPAGKVEAGSKDVGSAGFGVGAGSKGSEFADELVVDDHKAASQDQAEREENFRVLQAELWDLHDQNPVLEAFYQPEHPLEIWVRRQEEPVTWLMYDKKFIMLWNLMWLFILLTRVWAYSQGGVPLGSQRTPDSMNNGVGCLLYTSPSPRD